MKNNLLKEDLINQARTIEKQALQYPNILIPVDPELAEFMGAFSETAVTLDDLEKELEDA